MVDSSSPTTSGVDGLVREDRVHRLVYTDPAIFSAEMSSVFGQTWVYCAHDSELPEPNDFKTGYLGLRPIIICRDRHGRVTVLFNRCSHRAATVCRIERGNAKSFQCPYHGWTYRNDGELMGVPWPDAYGDDLDRSQLGLRRLRVDSYRGFIFATLNDSAPPLREHLGAAAPLLDQWLDRTPSGTVTVRSGANRMVYRGNWKLAYDNAADGYHPAFSHRSLLQLGQRYGDSNKDMVYFGQSPDQGPMYAQYLGNGHTFIDQRPSYGGTGSYWAQQRPQPGREAFEERVRHRYGADADRLLDLAVGGQMNLNIFPNLLIIGNQIQVIEPLAVDRTQLTWHATTADDLPDEINALRMRTQEDFPAFGEPDDQANFEETQRGLGVAEVEWVMMHRGLSLPGRDKTDDQGVVSGPVTDEHPMRGYYGEWLRLMRSAGSEPGGRNGAVA